ncbi:MAG: lytic transglycosylase domain-containing protein [Candidatus Nitrospinota bacterium M3_3B_026]
MTFRAGLKAAVLFLLLAAPSAWAFCFEDAGARYGVSPDLLRAIAWVESRFDPEASNRNADGSVDRGLMQVNSWWERRLPDFSEAPGPCANVMAGAWVLSECVVRLGYTWSAVGCYHSPRPDRAARYAWKVYEAWRAMDGARP